MMNTYDCEKCDKEMHGEEGRYSKQGILYCEKCFTEDIVCSNCWDVVGPYSDDLKRRIDDQESMCDDCYVDYMDADVLLC